MVLRRTPPEASACRGQAACAALAACSLGRARLAVTWHSCGVHGDCAAGDCHSVTAFCRAADSAQPAAFAVGNLSARLCWRPEGHGGRVEWEMAGGNGTAGGRWWQGERDGRGALVAEGRAGGRGALNYSCRSSSRSALPRSLAGPLGALSTAFLCTRAF